MKILFNPGIEIDASAEEIIKLLFAILAIAGLLA